MGQARVLVVAWDGADGSTVAELIEQGCLPNLARLHTEGTCGSLDSLPGLGDDASWSSFATMVSPGVHGRFHHRQPIPGSYRSAYFQRDQMTLPPFWELIAQAGQKVAALDVPKSPIGRGPNLRELTNWMPHGADPGGLKASSADIARRVAQVHAADRFSCHRVLNDDELPSYTASVLKRLRLRQQLALEWLCEESWDLFLVAFAESHCIGHHCWHLHDAEHPQHAAGMRNTIGDPIVDVYRAQDEALGRLVDAAGPGATVLVFSPLSMGPNYNGDRFIDEILRRLEGRESDAPSFQIESRGSAGRVPFLSSLRDRLARRSDSIRFGDRKYFSLQHDAISSAVRFNVDAREPAGVIQPGADYDWHCRNLTESLLAVYDPICDRPVIKEVVKVAERYPGPFADRFADLLVVWSNDAPIKALSSPGIDSIEALPSLDRTGNHRGSGWFVLSGRSDCPEPSSLTELGPAIAAMLGVALPDEGIAADGAIVRR